MATNLNILLHVYMCHLNISLLGLIQVHRFYSITDTEMMPRTTRRLIKIFIHVKEYLNQPPKWSIVS